MVQTFSLWAEANLPAVLISMLFGWLVAIAIFAWFGFRSYRFFVSRSPVKRREAVYGATQVLRESGRRAEVVTRKVLRWVQRRLIQLLCVLLLPILAYALWRSDQVSPPNPTRQLALLALILAAAAVAQFGDRLMHRLKKVGPVEFVEQRVERIIPELDQLPYSVDIDSPERPSLRPKLLYEYEKVDRYVSHLEWTGLRDEGVVGSEKFHDLLLKISALALIQHDWIRAADRLELLLKVSDGGFRPAEVLYRCGVAYRHLAKVAQGKEREELLIQAQHYLSRATVEDCYNASAFFSLADVQAELGFWQLARKNNLKAVEIRPDFAAAKVNLAVCLLKLNRATAALRRLKSIRPNDRDAGKMAASALRDEELKALRDHPRHGQATRQFLETFLAPDERGNDLGAADSAVST